MFERFTNRAKEILILAAREAQHLGHQQISTPDVLLALIREGRGVAMVALTMMNVDFRQVAEAACRPLDAPDDMADHDGQYTRAVRRLFQRAAGEADALRDNAIGTEHLLLAMLADGECQATQVLAAAGVRADVVRTVLVSLLHGASDHAAATDSPGLPDPQAGITRSRLSVQLSSHASEVDALANEEAHRLNHDWVATEHLLLALLRDGGNAAQLLGKHGVDLPRARHTAARLLPMGARASPDGRLPLTLGAQHVLQYAVQQARPLQEDVLYLATEHLLLGILRETKSIAGAILRTLGVDLDEFRQEVESLIDADAVPPEDEGEDLSGGSMES
jgi:ATP-dependent Clp protease ATP-binding subunit ClpA